MQVEWALCVVLEILTRKGEVKVDLGKTKVIANRALQSLACLKVEFTHGVCDLRVKANSILCMHCGKWIHSRCAGVRMVTPKFQDILVARNVKGIHVRQLSRNKVCNQVKIAGAFTYLGDNVSTGGECRNDVTARTRCGLG